MRVNTTDLATSGLGALAAPAPARQTAGTAFAAKLADAAAAAEARSPKGETTREVDGKPYVEVMSGPRNGMFINRSGNERDGEAFVLVTRKDHELHIYGTGRDRRVIVARYDDADDAGDKGAGKSTGTPATGGAAAPSGHT
jgi:hypothetical protein